MTVPPSSRLANSTVSLFWSLEAAPSDPSYPLPVLLDQLRLLCSRSSDPSNDTAQMSTIRVYASLAERPLEEQREVRRQISDAGATLTSVGSVEQNELERFIVVDCMSTALDAALSVSNISTTTPSSLGHLTIILVVAAPAPFLYSVSALRNRGARVLLVVEDAQEKRLCRGRADEVWTWSEVMELGEEEQARPVLLNGAPSQPSTTSQSDSSDEHPTARLSLSARLSLGRESSGGTALGGLDLSRMWDGVDGDVAPPSSESTSEEGEVRKEQAMQRNARQALYVDTTSKAREEEQDRFADLNASAEPDSAVTPSPATSSSALRSATTSLASLEDDPSVLRWTPDQPWIPSARSNAPPPESAGSSWQRIDDEDALASSHANFQQSPSEMWGASAAHESEKHEQGLPAVEGRGQDWSTVDRVQSSSSHAARGLAARFISPRIDGALTQHSPAVPPPLNSGWAARAAAKKKRSPSPPPPVPNTAFTRGASISDPIPSASPSQPSTSALLRMIISSNTRHRLYPPLAPLVLAFRSLKPSLVQDDGRVTRGALGRRILDAEPEVYRKLEREESGLWCFRELVKLAEERGVVECGEGETRQQDWVRLTKDWR